MTKRNRNTLKNYFLNGSVPTEDQFEDLVDSTLNIIDEGFDKSPSDGLKISQLGDSGRLISFYKENLAGRPLYFIRVDRDENLVVGTEDSRNILFIAENQDGARAVRHQDANVAILGTGRGEKLASGACDRRLVGDAEAHQSALALVGDGVPAQLERHRKSDLDRCHRGCGCVADQRIAGHRQPKLSQQRLRSVFRERPDPRSTRAS